jgi:hypothetical protein
VVQMLGCVQVFGGSRAKEVQGPDSRHAVAVPMSMQDVQGKSRVPVFHELCSSGNREVQGTRSVRFQ